MKVSSGHSTLLQNNDITRSAIAEIRSPDGFLRINPQPKITVKIVPLVRSLIGVQSVSVVKRRVVTGRSTNMTVVFHWILDQGPVLSPLGEKRGERRTGSRQLGGIGEALFFAALLLLGFLLLVTIHRPAGLPELIQLQPNLLIAQRVVAHLQRHHDEAITAEDVRRQYRHHSYNLRKLLFRLQDLFEERRLHSSSRCW